jgi:hypothetical protein
MANLNSFTPHTIFGMAQIVFYLCRAKIADGVNRPFVLEQQSKPSFWRGTASTPLFTASISLSTVSNEVSKH